MSRRKNKQIIPINIRKDWEVPKGHASHRGGGGQHDNRPRKLRTRQNINKHSIREFNDDS